MLFSLAEKPEPVIVIELPATPLVLFDEIVGNVTNARPVTAAVAEPFAPIG